MKDEKKSVFIRVNPCPIFPFASLHLRVFALIFGWQYWENSFLSLIRCSVVCRQQPPQRDCGVRYAAKGETQTQTRISNSSPQTQTRISNWFRREFEFEITKSKDEGGRMKDEKNPCSSVLIPVPFSPLRLCIFASLR